MIFVERNESGDIVAVYENPQPGKELELAEKTSDEVLEFMARFDK